MHQPTDVGAILKLEHGTSNLGVLEEYEVGAGMGDIDALLYLPNSSHKQLEGSLREQCSCRIGVCHAGECALIEGAVDYEPDPLEPRATGSLLESGGAQIAVGTNPAHDGPQVVSEVDDRRPALEPIAVIDAVHDQSRLDHQSVRDYRVMVRKGPACWYEVRPYDRISFTKPTPDSSWSKLWEFVHLA